MARDRRAASALAAQRDASLPETRELSKCGCKIPLPDGASLKAWADSGTPRPVCTSECEIVEFFKSVQKPVEIEIGCGMGRFLLSRARSFPETAFLGVELEPVRIARVDVAARKEELANLNVFCAEALPALTQCVPANSVRAVYVFFPDPWPKAKHKRRRLFQANFVDAAHRVLSDGGALYVSTDHAEYFEQMREVMSGETRFREVAPLKRTEEELTDFELIFLAKSCEVFSAAWKKV